MLENTTVTSMGAVETTPEQSTDQLAKNYSLVYQVCDALRDVNHKGDVMSYPLLDLLTTGAWKQFRANNGREYTHNYFGDFITAEIPNGLGTTADKLRAIVRGDGEAERLLEEALMRGAGNPTGANQHRAGIYDNVQGSTKAPTGNSRAATIRRIVKIAHDETHELCGKAEKLLQEVYDGKTSANKAAIELGLRKAARKLSDPNVFDLKELTEQVRQEIEHRKAVEEWSTRDLIEEALRQYFRVLQSEEIELDENDELVSNSENVNHFIESLPVDYERPNGRWPKIPAGMFQAREIAYLCEIPENALRHQLKANESTGEPFEIINDKTNRLFVREPGEMYFHERT